MINEEKIHSSWIELFRNQKEVIQEIEQKIGDNYTPNKERVFRFAEMELSKIKCISIGKDPYPNGAGTGRAFEVKDVSSWDDPKINRSLQNILKLIHKTHFELDVSLGIEEIRKEIRDGKFPISPPDKVFDYWEKEGVLFLNSALTTELGVIGKHLKMWSPFFKELLRYIAYRNPDIVYFLWGDVRKYKGVLLDLGVSQEMIYTSYHPSSFYGDKGGFKYDGKFLHNPCFKETLDKIRWI